MNPVIPAVKDFDEASNNHHDRCGSMLRSSDVSLGNRSDAIDPTGNFFSDVGKSIHVRTRTCGAVDDADVWTRLRGCWLGTITAAQLGPHNRDPANDRQRRIIGAEDLYGRAWSSDLWVWLADRSARCAWLVPRGIARCVGRVRQKVNATDRTGFARITTKLSLRENP